MHFVGIIVLDVPFEEEDVEKNFQVTETIDYIQKEEQKHHNIMNKIWIEKLNNLRTTFSRNVTKRVEDVLEMYDDGCMEFCDTTDQYRKKWETECVECIQLPQGKIVPAYTVSGFVIYDGKVYQKYSGPLKHERRTKKAKRMKAWTSYPIKKLFPSFSEYMQSNGFEYSTEYNAYGYYYNSYERWDGYQIGGRWSQAFLVKKTCKEYSMGECKDYLYDAPEEFRWAAAARKKDIEWEKYLSYYKQSLVEEYHKYKTYYITKIQPKGLFGIRKNDGIYLQDICLYKKEETVEEYLDRRNIYQNRKYPVIASAWLDNNEWITFQPHDKETGNTIDDFIDAMSDEAVICAVDFHF